MYETHEQYREIVRREVQLLEKTCHCTIVDGDIGFCPRCGHHGVWDIATKGFKPYAGNCIYYSTVFNEWRCGCCNDCPRVKAPAASLREKPGSGGRIDTK